MTAQTKDISSIGYLSQNLQASVQNIRRAANALKMEPCLVLNGVEHFDDQQVQQIRNRLKPTTTTEGHS